MRWVLLLAPCALAFGQDKEESPKILRHQAFQVEPIVPDDRAEALIDRLTGLDRPRDGLRSDSGGGISFSLTDDAFGRLVKMGPAALPALLRHLDDGRETRLAFLENPEAMGGVFRNDELLVPPTRPAERKRIRDAVGEGIETDVQARLDIDKRLEGHTVTVGDCCFAILGQIVNRPYEAVRGQGTLITAVCSPTLDPRIAKAVRAAWGYRDPRKVLAESLQDDFHSRAPGMSWPQAGAAARLCVYFPEQGGPLVARRVAGLRFDADRDGIAASDLLWLVLRTDDPAVRKAWMAFLDPARPKQAQLIAIDAISRKPDPEVLQRIREVFDKTDDAALMLACLEWLPLDRKGLFERLDRRRRRSEARGEKGYPDCQKLLGAMIRVDKKKALASCRAHINGGYFRKRIALVALYRARDRDLALALLPALLEETALLGWWPDLPDSVARLQPRVCDFAAAALARGVKELRFTNAEKVADRDLEIARMQKALTAR